jgi:hypothetical protein
MKKIVLFIAIVLSCSSYLHAAVFVGENPSADKLMLPLFNSGKMISLADFMKLKNAEYKKITGTRMSLKERITLKIFQHHFKNSINSDGTVNVPNYKEDVDDMHTFRFDWFALGFFLGLFGLLIALVINDDKRRARIKWVGIGFLAYLVFALIIIVAVLASLGSGY